MTSSPIRCADSRFGARISSPMSANATWPSTTAARPAGGARWYHQHFGASKEPLRLTAWFGPHNPGREPGPPGEKHTDYTAMDITEGGSSIPYWMEDPFISAEYEAKLKAEGVPSRMDPAFYKKVAVVPKFAGA